MMMRHSVVLTDATSPLLFAGCVCSLTVSRHLICLLCYTINVANLPSAFSLLLACYHVTAPLPMRDAVPRLYLLRNIAVTLSSCRVNGVLL